MSLEICVLASGSAGNAAILRSPAGILLIDAGIDGDHFSARWVSTLRRLNIPIFFHANKADALASSSPDLGPLIRPFDVDGVQLPGSRPRAVQHGPTDRVAPPIRRRAIDARVLIRRKSSLSAGSVSLGAGCRRGVWSILRPSARRF
jgi:hypothetical protein